MSFAHRVLIAVIMTALVACASAGRRFDTTHVDDVQTGATTKSEVRVWFGEPYKVEPLVNHPAGGIERWLYTYAFSKAGLSTTSETLVVDFNAESKVCDHAFVRQ